MDTGRVLPVVKGVGAFPGVLLVIGYITLILTGFFGFIEGPSNAVQDVAGSSLASYLWNTAFVVSGVTGLVARFTRAPRVEVIAVETVATTILVWAIFVLGSSAVSNQGAFALVGFAFLLYGWSAGTRRALHNKSVLMQEDEILSKEV